MKIELNKPFARNGGVDEFDVKQIKKALNRLGYYRPHAESGITGIPDADVFAALKSFQKDSGLRASGAAKPDDETVDALNTAVSKTPEGKYIWRTVGDDRVRPEHAALEGEVREWNDSPDPGEEFNCRCWAEPLDKKKLCQELSIELQNERLQWEELNKMLSETIEKLNSSLQELRDAQEHLQKLEAERALDIVISGMDTNIPRGAISIGTSYLSYKEAIDKARERADNARAAFENAQFSVSDLNREIDETGRNIEGIKDRMRKIGCLDG